MINRNEVDGFVEGRHEEGRHIETFTTWKAQFYFGQSSTAGQMKLSMFDMGSTYIYIRYMYVSLIHVWRYNK